ncbi:MAG: hypothetical protein Q8914_00945 [Bacteroidota bacterium]|nr:hypothetical protein [Bacteroidota bacterium]
MTKAERLTGIILACLLFLMTLNSTWYFLGVAKVSVLQWLVFNACAPSSVAYLAGFILFLTRGNKVWLSVAVIPIFFFGTMGFFVFPWNGYNLMAQISHITMTLNMLWGLWLVLKEKNFEALGKGLLISTVIFVPFISFTQDYCRAHAGDVTSILGI